MRVQENKVDTGHNNLQNVPNQSVQFKDNRKESTTNSRIQLMANSSANESNNTGLPNQLKSGIESLSGYSMDDVKVHYNSSKPAQLNAHAYAQGTDIHVASGQEKHLAHETWHVVQQKQGRVQPTRQLMGKVHINDDAGLEREADVMGAKALQMKTTVPNVCNLCTNGNRVQLVQRAVAGYEIKSGDELSNVTVNVTPAKNAIVSTEPVPLGDKVDANAYIGNVATIARGKDKNPVGIANQYKTEAFPTPEAAAKRFALVVGVNSMESAAEEENTQKAKIQSEVDTAKNISAFPAGAIGHLWRPKWVKEGTSDEVPIQEVRDAVDKDASDKAEDDSSSDSVKNHLNKAGASVEEYKNARKGIHKATRKSELKVEEKKRSLSNAPNLARNLIMKSTYTKEFKTMLEERYKRVYIHVSDPDAVNMKAKEDPSDLGSVEKTLFERFDNVIGAHKASKHVDPAIVAGGYRFRHLGTGDDPMAAGPDGDSDKVKAKSLQTVKSSELDMKVREAAASVNPAAPYWPEPNLLLNTQNYDEVTGGDKKPFGDKNVESLHLRDHLLSAHNANWFKTHAAFDTKAAVYTDAGRFDDPYSDDDPRFKTGKLSKDELTSGKALQSHAKPDALAKKVSALYALNNGAVKAVFEVIFTNDIVAEANRLKDYVNTRTNDNKPNSRNDLVIAITGLPAATIGGISKNVLWNLFKEIPDKKSEWVDAINVAIKSKQAIDTYKAGFVEAPGT